ncbi:hypothetical protein TEA_028722 [Camellia sinensis var. sinensis]|uniref:Uncharacterized protein n=1 Tax=Camellia sinensis var. sinensis TaxID=542762 RepID=A0A4S4EAI4_CAMSN|nr:hypothetical protein TEA_028722 [Camellia sinensis var. sinensis]
MAQTSKESRQAKKRPRCADPIAKLVAELSTEQTAEASEPTPPWQPQLKHWGKEIPTNASIKGDKEHLLTFDLTKALLLPSDVISSDHVPETRLVKSSVKSMTRAIQKQHLVIDRIHKLWQKQIEITCRGQELLPFLTLQHVRDSIWRSPRDAVTLLADSSSSTTDHVMVLHYARSA